MTTVAPAGPTEAVQTSPLSLVGDRNEQERLEPFPAFDHRRRLLLALALGIAGLLALVIGWVGVSGTRIISDQLAFIASGGMLGLALVALAGAAIVVDYLIEVESRLHALEARLRGTATDRAVAAGTDLIEVGRRKRLVLAAALAVGGLLAILAGWLGTSGTRDIADQLSFIASGGTIGVALVALAGVLVLADSMGAQQSVLDRLDSQVTEPLFSGSAVPSVDQDLSIPHEGPLVTVPGGTRVHRSGCQLVLGKSVDAVPPGNLDAALQPCRVCTPSLEPNAASMVSNGQHA